MKKLSVAFVASAAFFGVNSPHAFAQQQSGPPMPIRVAYQDRSSMGGGFIEFLFNGGQSNPAYQQPRYEYA